MSGRIIQVDGHYLNVARRGEGPAVVLLHGWASSWHHWKPFIPALVDAGFSVYAPDLFGHGKSYHAPDASNYGIETYYRSICCWLKTEGLKNPILVGHSMGGYLSLKYAIKNPQKVRGLALIDPLVNQAQIAASPMVTGQWSPTFAEMLFRLLPERLVKYRLEMNTRDVAAVDRATREQIAIDFKRASAHIFRTLPTITDLTPDLHQVTMPTLLMWGNRDLALHPDSFPALLAKLPSAEGHCFEETYHMPHYARQTDFLQRLIPFLKQVSSQTETKTETSARQLA